MTCNLCSLREMINEARDEEHNVWVAPQEPYGFNLFVIPTDAKVDLRLRRDNCYGPQRKAWFNEIPAECTCGEEVEVKHPPSTWRPDEEALTPEPEEPETTEPEPLPFELAQPGSIEALPRKVKSKVVALSLL